MSAQSIDGVRSLPSLELVFIYCLLTLNEHLSCPAHRFNKREEEFPSKKDFDDYLEEREDISEFDLPSSKVPLPANC